MFSRMYHAWKTFLRKTIVDVRSLSTSCCFLPLHHLAFSDVSHSRFYRYHVVFFHCIISRLAMRHSRVFSLKNLEILKRYIVSPSIKCPRGCIACGKHFYVRRAWMWDRCEYHVVFFHCIISRLAICHSRVFSLGILEILKRYIASPSLKCHRGCITRGKHFYVRRAWMWDRCRYHVVLFHCIILRLGMCHIRVFSLGILEILKRCIVSPSLQCPRGCITRGKYFYVRRAWMWDRCRHHVVFFHCIISRLGMCHSRVFIDIVLFSSIASSLV